MDKDISMNSNSRIAALLFFCAVAAFSGVAFAESASCIVSGSTVRDAVHSGVSDSVTELDAVASIGESSSSVLKLDSVSSDSDISEGGNLNSLSVGFMIILR